MSPGGALVADIVAGLLLALLAGILFRGLAPRCWSFAAYAMLALVTNRLITWWPERFFTFAFVAAKELGYAALVVLVVGEMAAVALRPFPRARNQALVAAVMVLGVAAVAVSATHQPDPRSRIGTTTALANGGAMLALVILLAVVQWYRLPLEPWHRAIALGFILYRGIYGMLLGSVSLFGLGAYRLLAALDPAAYAATVVLWTLGAWLPSRSVAIANADEGATT